MMVFFLNLRFRWSILFLLLLTVNCEDRQHRNPLDPLNPETRGRPVGLQLVLGEGGLTLSWQPINLDGPVAIRILRAVNNSEFMELVLVNNGNQYIDRDVEYGNRYSYTIQAILPNYQTPYSDTVSVLHGPSEIWVAAGFSGTVFRLTFDGAHLLNSIDYFLYPYGITQIEVGGIFLTDFYLDQVVRISRSGTILRWISGYRSPAEIVYDSSRNVYWVADRDAGEVIMADTLGNVLHRSTVLPAPEAISLDPERGRLWVADSRFHRVAVIFGNGDPPLLLYGFQRAWDLDVNPKTGECWIADSSRVLKYSPDGKKTLTFDQVSSATAVAVDPISDVCWVIDYSLQKGRSRLLKLSNLGEKLLELSGFYRPFSIDVDTFDNSCIVADTYNSRIVKVSADGDILSEWLAPAAPTTVRVTHP